MFAPDSQHAPNIAVITLVCGWLFTAIALLSLLLLVLSRRLSGSPLRVDDYLLFTAFAIAIALAAHTSWAIVDEGLGRQQRVVSIAQRATLVKVRFDPQRFQMILTS